MTSRLDLQPYGDAGLLAGVLGDDYETRWRTTQALAVAVRAAPPPWLVDLVATYDHLFVTFDPGLCNHLGVGKFLEQLSRTLDASTSLFEADSRTFRVPVLFGGDAGPDLEAVAEELSMSANTLVDRLSAGPWRVRFVASPFGTPFTDRMDWDVSVPRMTMPRVAVPPCSIALSGRQSIIYPVKSPGGWRLVGRTPLSIVDPTDASDNFAAYRAGDKIEYVPIDNNRFAELKERGGRLVAEL